MLRWEVCPPCHVSEEEAPSVHNSAYRSRRVGNERRLRYGRRENPKRAMRAARSANKPGGVLLSDSETLVRYKQTSCAGYVLHIPRYTIA